MSSFEPLNPTELRAALVGTRFPARLHHFPTAESTNTLLFEAAANGAPEGAVYLADEQTVGRGRGGHAWHSAPGDGLYLSVLAKPALRLREALWISLATALAVQSAIKSTTGLSIDIRWPNDLLHPQASSPGRKVGGILVEASVNPGEDPLLRYAVIGIGINLNHAAFPPELDPIATSIRRELPADLPLREEQEHSTRSVENSTKCLPREPLAAAILRALATEIHQLSTDNVERTTDNSPESHSTWLCGKRVRVEPRADQPGGYTGTTAGLDPHGFLRVATDDGQLRTVLTGGLREP